jgi:Spy/CpxP family protein refolding chaperone
VGYWNITEAGYGTCEDLAKACDLTADQKKQILDIEAAKTKVMNDNDAVAATKGYRDEFYKAMASGDKDVRAKAIAKYDAARETIQETFAKAQAKIDEANTKAQAQIDKVLTSGQKAKWKEYNILKDVKQLQQGFKFNDEQWNKIMDTYEKLAKNPAIKFSELVMKLAAKIDAILTPEQKAKKLLATKYAMMNQTVHFTDEQLTKLVKIEDERDKETAELRAKNDAPQNEQDGTTYNGLNKKYDDKVQAILTDPQTTAWQEVVKKIREDSIRD